MVKFVGKKYGQSMWTNLPVSDARRPGIWMVKQAAHGLLKAVLSPMGYQKVWTSWPLSRIEMFPHRKCRAVEADDQ